MKAAEKAAAGVKKAAQGEAAKRVHGLREKVETLKEARDRAVKDVQQKIAKKQETPGDALIDMWQSASWLQGRRYQLPASQFKNCTSDAELAGTLADLQHTKAELVDADVLVQQALDHVAQRKKNAERWEGTPGHERSETAVAAARAAQDQVEVAEEELAEGAILHVASRLCISDCLWFPLKRGLCHAAQDRHDIAATAWRAAKDRANLEHEVFVALPDGTRGATIRLLRPQLKASALSMTALKQLLTDTCMGVQNDDLLKVRLFSAMPAPSN